MNGDEACNRRDQPRYLGAAIGLRIVEILDGLGAETHLVVSRAAERTLAEEVGPDALSHLRAGARHWHGVDDIGASIASGSFPTGGMIVAPCSMRTLAAIAHCLADNLLVRAADIQLKERRPLVLVAREAPLHLGHLRAMTAATEAGAIVMPPVPAFYLKPVSVDEVIDQIARRAVGSSCACSNPSRPRGMAYQEDHKPTMSAHGRRKTDPKLILHLERGEMIAEFRLKGVRVRNETLEFEWKRYSTRTKAKTRGALLFIGGQRGNRRPPSFRRYV